MSDPSTEDNLRLAHELADIADAVTLSRFGAADLVIDEKPDGSPVTDADTLVEERLRAHLRTARPRDAVTGEEGGDSGGGGPWRWLLDPIDGTVAFARHQPGWTTLIALVREDESCLGLVSDPVRGDRWWAVRGGGAYRNGARLHVSATGRLAEATVGDDWEESLANGKSEHLLARLATRCAQVRPYDLLSTLTVASGIADVTVETGGHPWDYAPLLVIAEEAGGRFTDLAGRPCFDAGLAVVSNGTLHPEALRALTGVL
jgi:histidinol-phosphatase